MKFLKRMEKKLAAAILAGAMSFSFGLNSASAIDVVDVNLDEAIQRALANNRTIKRTIASRESAYWAYRQARRQTGPTLSWSTQAEAVGGSQNANYDKRLFGNTASVTMPLYAGNRYKEGRVSARYGLNTADLTLENTLQTVRLTATNYYFNILRARNEIEVYEENVRTLNEYLNNVNAQFRAGTVAKADVLATEVRLANAQQTLITAQNEYDIAVATLCNFLLRLLSATSIERVGCRIEDTHHFRLTEIHQPSVYIDCIVHLSAKIQNS